MQVGSKLPPFQNATIRREGGEEVQGPHTRHPAPGTCTGKTSPLTLALKANRAYLWESQRAVEAEALLLEGRGAAPVGLRSSTEAAVWKVPGLYMQEIYWLTLRCMLEGQRAGTCRSLAGGGGPGGSSLA